MKWTQESEFQNIQRSLLQQNKDLNISTDRINNILKQYPTFKNDEIPQEDIDYF